jgi:hypothetical protein
MALPSCGRTALTAGASGAALNACFAMLITRLSVAPLALPWPSSPAHAAVPAANGFIVDRAHPAR